MNKIGANELSFPCIISCRTFKQRLKTNSNTFLKVDRGLVLVPTAEEIMLELPSKYRPKVLYQCQQKFRKEVRTSHGLLRSIEFTMLDCYISMTTRHNLVDKLKQAIINCWNDCYSLDLKAIVSVSEAMEIGGSYSLELSIYDINKNITKYYVPARIITRIKWNYRWIGFTDGFVRSKRVVLNDNYLFCSGIEVMHAFVFNKIEGKSLWIASLGIGISRIVGIIMLKKTYYLTDIIIFRKENLFQYLPLNNYARYIYAIATSIGLKTILFNKWTNLDIFLNNIIDYNTRYTLFINVENYGFNMKVIIPLFRYEFKVNLQMLLKLLNSAGVR